MASWVRDCLSLNSSKNSNMVNSKEVSCQIDVSNQKIPKQIFARWQAILSAFDFDIEFIQGKDNSLPDFVTREFLQGSHHQL